MRNGLRTPIGGWVAVICIGLLPLQHKGAEFVEIQGELNVEDWDYRLFRDRIGYGSESNLKLPGIFTGESAIRCLVGIGSWMIEFSSENARTTYWFTGSNIIEHAVVTTKMPGRSTVADTRTYRSNDGNPGRPVHVPDIMGTGSICWLSFCSGSYLKRDGHQIFPPSPFWKESSLAYGGWTERTAVFEDGLGLPKSVDLIATNNQPVFQYQVHQSTNILGWNFPLEFYCIQYLPTVSNLWKLALTAKGRVISIREGARLEVPKEVLEAVATQRNQNQISNALSTGTNSFPGPARQRAKPLYVLKACGGFVGPTNLPNSTPAKLSFTRFGSDTGDVAFFRLRNDENRAILLWNVRVQVRSKSSAYPDPPGWLTVHDDYPEGTSKPNIPPGSDDELMVRCPAASAWRVCIVYSKDWSGTGTTYAGDYELISEEIHETQ